MGLRGVGGASESLAKSAHVSEAIGAGGVGREWKFTGTDYNSGLSTTGASSWFLVLGSTLNTTGNNVELLSASGSGNNGIRVTSTNYPEFRVASTTHITGSQLAAGQSIYARFTTSSYVLSQRNKGTGSITWQTSSANYGTISPNWIMDAKSLSVALAIRFGYSPPRATIEYLHLNPWAIFKAPARRILVGVATTATVSPETGGYTYTGNSPTIIQPRTVAPSSGAYTYIGNTPAISQPRTIAPAVGSYAYLGSTPEVSQIAGIRPTTGGYVYTGNTPSIGQPRTIAPLEGAYAYAGNTPTVSQSAGVSLSPEDLAAIADAVWADPVAVAAHAKLDAILARLTC